MGGIGGETTATKTIKTQHIVLSKIKIQKQSQYFAFLLLTHMFNYAIIQKSEAFKAGRSLSKIQRSKNKIQRAMIQRFKGAVYRCSFLYLENKIHPLATNTRSQLCQDGDPPEHRQ